MEPRGRSYRTLRVSEYNHKPGNWGHFHEELLGDGEAPAHIHVEKAQESGEKLRERLLQDRAATSVVTALLLTIAFGMLVVDPGTVQHKFIFDPTDREGIPFVRDPADNVKATSEQGEAVGRRPGEALGPFQFGLVRAAYVFCCTASSMLSFLSVYISTWEYLLINRCPASRMIFLVDYLHCEHRSRLSIALEPWRTTIGAAVALMLSMSVLVYALYGGMIWALAVLTIVAMSAMGVLASRRLHPDKVFEQVELLNGEHLVEPMTIKSA